MAIAENHKLIEVIRIYDNVLHEVSVILGKYPKIKKSLICSVRSDFDDLIQFIYDKGIVVSVLDAKMQIPIRNEYKSCNTLGYDRIAAIIGARSIQSEHNLLVIDAGTAITFDFLIDNAFIGGAISAGISLRFKALNHFTDKLPLLEQSDGRFFIGNDTKSAILAGVQEGAVYEMDGLISLAIETYPGICVFLSGGDSFFFAKRLKNSIFVEPELVLLGLNEIIS